LYLITRLHKITVPPGYPDQSNTQALIQITIVFKLHGYRSLRYTTKSEQRADYSSNIQSQLDVYAVIEGYNIIRYLSPIEGFNIIILYEMLNEGVED